MENLIILSLSLYFCLINEYYTKKNNYFFLFMSEVALTDGF